MKGELAERFRVAIGVIANKHLDRAGLDEHSDPVQLQAVLDQAVAEVNEVVAGQDALPCISISTQGDRLMIDFVCSTCRSEFPAAGKNLCAKCLEPVQSDS